MSQTIVIDGDARFDYEHWSGAAYTLTMCFYRKLCACDGDPPRNYEDIGANLKLHAEECVYRKQITADREYALKQASALHEANKLLNSDSA